MVAFQPVIYNSYLYLYTSIKNGHGFILLECFFVGMFFLGGGWGRKRSGEGVRG